MGVATRGDWLGWLACIDWLMKPRRAVMTDLLVIWLMGVERSLGGGDLHME